MANPCSINLTLTPPEAIQVGLDQEPGLFPVVLQIGPPGPVGPPGTIPESLELFLMWDANYPSFYLTYTYLLGVLTDIDMWTDNTKTTKIFNKHFIYSGLNLTEIIITHISDGATETKQFTYSSGDIVAQQVTQ
jgi:hypothetical protein